MLAAVCALLLVAPADTVELSLADALRVALTRSPVRTEVAVTRTQGGTTLAGGIAALLPAITGSVGYGRAEAAPGSLPESLRLGDWSWTGNLTVSQVVFDPSAFASLAGSIIYAGYYAADARDKQARLIYDVTADYLGLLKSRLLLDAARAAGVRTDENLNVVQVQQGLGSASRIDVMRAEVQASQAVIEILSAEKAVAVAAETFKATAGIDEDIAIRPTEQLTEPPALQIDNPDSLLAEIGRRNPGAQLAARANAVAGINAAAAIGRALPSVSAYWSSSYTDSTFPSSIGRWHDGDAISYGIRASFPLLDLKSYVLDVVSSFNESRRTRAAARKATLQLRSAAAAAVLGYREARQRYDTAVRNLVLNRELYDLAREQHRLGAISLLDLFSVEANLAAAEASHISALGDTYIQAAQINYLLGLSDATARPAPGEEE